MKSLLHKVSGTLIFTGVLSILFGIISFAWPGITLMILVWLFAITAVVQGIAQVTSSIQHRKTEDFWWIVLLWGIINVAAGMLAVAYPGVTAIILVVFIGCAWLFTGVLQLIAAYVLRKDMKKEGLLALGGILSIVAGIYILRYPGQGAIAMIWLIAAYAFIFGIVTVMVGLRARKWGQRIMSDEG